MNRSNQKILSKRRKWSQNVFIMVLITIAYVYYFKPWLRQSEHLNASFLLPSTRLNVVNFSPWSQPRSAFERIVLTQFGKHIPLHDLSQLRGRVLIPDEKSALEYVRLLTSLRTYDLWGDGATMIVEVIDEDKVYLRSSYGLKRPYTGGMSGNLGILSRADFHKGNFSYPQVKTIQGHFLIYRWLFSIDNHVLFVREHVSKDGDYSRDVIRVKDPPSLPTTQWQFPAVL